jgi:hypothetical protein
MTTYAGPFSTEDYAYAPDQSAAWGVALFTPYNVQEIEERDFGRGPLLWDADPDVCCAAFQLGACPHTEGEDAEWDTEDALEPTWGETIAAWDPDTDGQGWAGLNAALDRLVQEGADEPF